MLSAEIERLHHESGIRLVGQPSLFTLPAPVLEYFLGVLSGAEPEPPPAPESDWWQLVNLAFPHKLLPLFYSELQRLPDSRRPPEIVVKHLKRMYVESRLRGLMMEAQLKDVLAAMSAVGADPLVLKGLALAYSYYGDAPSRPATDIDLLVRPDQYPAAKRALLGLGYRDHSGHFENMPFLANESSFVHGQSDYRVDLHWNMHPYNRVDREREAVGLVERAVVVQHGQFACRTLGPVDELIQSARHLTWNHRSSVRLVWVYDLQRVARRIEAEGLWEEARGRSAEWHAAAAVWQALELVRAWTGFTPRPPYDQRGTWAADDPFEQELWRRVQDSRRGSTSLLWLAWNPGWPLTRKVGFLLSLAFPPRERMRKNYPPARPWLLPLSYVARFYRAARRFAT